jgi:hypothetical protein
VTVTELLSYVERHPVWFLVYLATSGVLLVGGIDALRKSRCCHCRETKKTD